MCITIVLAHLGPDTHRDYNDSVTHLPNPDAVLSGGEMKGLDYLIAWATAFGEE